MSFLRPLLAPSVARALPFIESGVARGLTTTALQRELSAGGIGVRRADLLEAVRNLRGAQLAADRLKFIPRGDFKPDPTRIPFAITQQLREFSFKVKVSGYDVLLDKQTDRYFSVSSKSNLSRDEIESIALGYAADTDHYTPFEPEVVNIISATRQ